MDKKLVSDVSDVKEVVKLLEDVNVKVVFVVVGFEVSLFEFEKIIINKKFIVIVGNDEDLERFGEEIIRKVLKSECFVFFKVCNLFQVLCVFMCFFLLVLELMIDVFLLKQLLGLFICVNFCFDLLVFLGGNILNVKCE